MSPPQPDAIQVRQDRSDAPVDPPPTVSHPARRLAWVDNLRTVMILLVVNMHACVTYSHLGGWYIKEPPEPTALPVKLAFILWQAHLQAFFMGLLFFLAGVFARKSIERRGAGAFLVERGRRLGLPSLFYMLAIHPFMVFVLLGAARYPEGVTLGELYRRYLVSGEVWSGSGPMWFALALLVFSAVLAALRASRPPSALDPNLKTASKSPSGLLLIGLAAALGLGTFLVRCVQPVGTDVLNFQLCYFPQYVVAFVLGVAAGRKDWLDALATSMVARRAGWLAVFGGPAALTVMAVLWGPPREGGPNLYAGGWNLEALTFALWEQTVGLGLALGCLSWFCRHLNSGGRWASWLADRSFAVYLFHPPILVALTPALRGLGTNAIARTAALTALGAVGTFIAADLVRRLPGLRWILGGGIWAGLGHWGGIGRLGSGLAILGLGTGVWEPKAVAAGQPLDPYDDTAIAAAARAAQPTVIHTAASAPPSPRLEDLALENRVEQYGIAWTFDRPARVGRFVNGDWYVVGPVTVRKIDPKPRYGTEIPDGQLDRIDRERPQAQRVRNGFMVNPPAAMKVAYDSGVRNWFDPTLIQKLPVVLKPGDSLVSTISMPKGLVLRAQLRNTIERGVDDSSPIRTAAVLTCVERPLPPDAFRPAFCDRTQRFYRARDLERRRLPRAAATPGMPNIERYVRFTQRPWVGTGFFGFEEPVENMPQYGLEYGRVAGISALLLCTDLEPERKEPLLLNLVQIGIDLGGMIRAGHPGWTGWGGHGSGRKLPILFAGLLLGDDALANINRSFPKASFGEDEQTAYGKGWTGAKVVFAGHSGIDAATGLGRSRGNDWGPYEHSPPSQWKEGQNTSESYRRCCTSVGWVAQALALRLMRAETAWNHDAFFDYVDRWMYEDDAEFVKTIRAATGRDHDHGWSRQGQAWDAFVNEMWARHRAILEAATDGWKQPHDERDYQPPLEIQSRTPDPPR